MGNSSLVDVLLSHVNKQHELKKDLDTLKESEENFKRK